MNDNDNIKPALDGSEAMAHDEGTMISHKSKRAWRSIVGLIMGVALWILVFLLPGGDFNDLQLQSAIVLVLAIFAFTLCFKGRKEERGVSNVGMVVNGALLLFDLIGLVGCWIIDKV